MFKRIIALGFLVGLCFSLLPSASVPTALAAQATPCAPNTDDEVEAIANAINQAYIDRDVSQLDGLLADDIIRDSPRGPETGKDQAVASFDRFFAAFPDLDPTFNLVLAASPLAAVHYTATGTQATALGGVEPTGEPVTFDGMYLIEVTCGKISHMWSAVDQLAQRGEGTSELATPVMDDDATPSDCAALTDESAATLMDAWYSDVWGGDLSALASITTEDAYHHWATGPDTSGQADQQAHLEETIAQFPGLAVTYANLVVDGDYIAVTWGDPNVDPNWGGINIFRVECGLIDEVWSEMDLTNLPTGAEATPSA